ncbi:RNA methyltransferase [Virgibacillus salarius]|uniref:TrmH family RNA methyltransferase n=1 Tax=Virgibacillus salarius TaxID=447199 RepID=UPI002490BEEF|nr:RNA methyltransferase [Virgibacillus salarius]WBX78961.1 RNA methyltransferase [Virgibacillus salarius]
MLTSVKNGKVKAWKKLHRRKERKNEGVFLIEGFHLVEEVWNSEWEVIEVIIQEGIATPDWCEAVLVTEVSETVFSYISQTNSPQGIAAVVKIKNVTDVFDYPVLLIDSLQDPGNLGTIIRTADAAGFSGIILGDDTVDVFNDKVIRATQGSLFHIPIIQANLLEQVEQLQQDGAEVWATALQDAEVYSKVKPKEKLALIVGNEGNGVKQELRENADKIVTIPIYGKAESLNVSIATGILMYYIKV